MSDLEHANHRQNHVSASNDASAQTIQNTAGWRPEAEVARIERNGHFAKMSADERSFLEFFAGGGMARAGLGPAWRCAFANDFDEMKVETYKANWGNGDIRHGDVGKLMLDDLPAGTPDLAWASFPCQDLSLAGDCRGLGRERDDALTRSGTFWPFWKLMRGLAQEGRAPRTIVLENVYGALTSHGGKDFAAIGSALSGSGYRFGAVVINASEFVPQSRPRVFFIAIRKGEHLPAELTCQGPDPRWTPAALVMAHAGLSAEAKKKWVWWNIPAPAARNIIFADIVEERPTGVEWHTAAETKYLLSMMSDVNRAKVAAAKKAGRCVVGGVYRRTRPDANGDKVQRAEVRFDDIAGCLRTPAGGSSRQSILVVDGPKVRSRLLSPREAARLMGLDDEYILPSRYNDAYHVCGDGVCVPVVRHIAQHVLEPILAATTPEVLIAAE
ncbi:MAG: DNA-cytosine methyltransferase [Hyphomicrobiales bacterium]|nr:DNA-cytosine methyltransferase [Hyphomicrobiales bacterium]